MREEKSYNGEKMITGRAAEEIVMAWLKSNPYAKQIIDTREFRISQRLDVDCGIEDMHGRVVLAEIKSDKWLGKSGKILLELFRINHFVPPFHYLGWFWRSPAERLLIYSPELSLLYSFIFARLRQKVGAIIAGTDKQTIQSWLRVVETDKQKTTFNLLVPENSLIGIFTKFNLKKGLIYGMD